MELILTQDEIKNIIKKHFNGVEEVKLDIVDKDVKATLTISEIGAMNVVKQNTAQKIAPVITNTDDIPKPATMGEAQRVVIKNKF